MASATRSEFLGLHGDHLSPAAGGFGVRLREFARLLDEALGAPRRWETDDEIARFLQRSGGRLTDSQEREIERRVLAAE